MLSLLTLIFNSVAVSHYFLVKLTQIYANIGWRFLDLMRDGSRSDLYGPCDPILANEIQGEA